MKAITLERAQELLRNYVEQKEKEELPILECMDRVLAENIYAQIDQPPFRRSSMDGYAVRSSDTKGASKENPVKFKVIDYVFAGTNEIKKITQNEAVRIMTGGMLPEGADCVVKQEDTDYGEKIVSVYREMQAGDYYAPIGQELAKRTLLAKEGTICDANVIATAVAAGISHLKVRKRVRAAIITTGDELCRLGEERKAGQIYPSNMAYLSIRLRQLGCEIVFQNQPVDRLDMIAAAISEALQKADVVITTGGVSVGKKDFLQEAVELVGAKVLSHGIAVNPGRPSMISVYQQKPIISLTGTPFSASVVFELLIHPILAIMLGTEEMELHHVTAVAQNDFSVSPKRSRQFIRGYFCDGKVYRMNQQSKAQNFAGIGTNCLIDVAEEAEKIEYKEEVKVYLIK